jgi:hypothetical protein
MSESNNRHMSSGKTPGTKKRSPSLHNKSANAKVVKENKGVGLSHSDDEDIDTKKGKLFLVPNCLYLIDQKL